MYLVLKPNKSSLDNPLLLIHSAKLYYTLKDELPKVYKYQNHCHLLKIYSVTEHYSIQKYVKFQSKIPFA